jgi:hypothetical protein
MRVSRILAVASGLALALSLYSCAFTSDLSGSLVGKVMVAGSSTPIPGAFVECEGVAAVSAADGNYSLEGIPPGDRVVYASAAGYNGYADIVTVEESTLHDIYMSTHIGPARLFGYVSHATIGPLEGASVQIGDLIVLTDSEGYYEYPNLEQTSYLMTVTKEDYRPFSQNVHLTSENNQVDVNVLRLATVILWSTADAGVIKDSPDENFGGSPELRLFNDEARHEKFFIRFPLDGLEETAEPSTATLRLYNTWPETSDEHRTILVGRPTESWLEHVVTWANSPQPDASIALSTYEDRWYEVSVGTYFSEWLVDDEDNFGLLVDTLVDHVADRFVFASREHAEEDKRPHVVLDYAW